MRNRTKKIGLSVGLILGGAVWILGAQLGQAQTQPPPQPEPTGLTGEELADELGLELVAEQPPGCSDYIVVASPDVGYCLEGKVQPGLESWDIGRRLAGIVPSEEDRLIFQLRYELSRLSPRDDRERWDEIVAELEDLQAG